MKIQEHVPLGPKTTFGIGKTARYYVEVKSEEDIREAIAWAQKKGIGPVILSGGSNVLLPDEELDALVIWIASDDFSFADTELEADAGCNLLSLIREATKRGLGGWEKLSGIPGAIGGAVRGNAGAFGPEIQDFTRTVRALNSKTGELKEFENAECQFSYRHSFFKDHPEWVILSCAFELRGVDPTESEKLIDETILEREKRHLQNVRAAGSYFMNPVAPKAVQERFEREKGVKSREGRVPAGWLIEKAGMKGATVGGAIASDQHPNYIVNTGSATAADVLALAEKIKDAVEKEFGIRLEEEAAVFA